MEHFFIKNWDALDLMSQFNGRSREDCIIYAMGYIPKGYYDHETGESNSGYWFFVGE